MNADLRAREKGTSPVSLGEAERVARLYQRLVLLAGLQLLLIFLGRLSDANAFALLGFVLQIGVFIALLVTSYKLIKQLGSGSPALRSIGMCLPVVNLFVLSGISSSAQAWCKRYGITVGFFGPTRESLERLRQDLN
jgi:hypothetical protein